ncbi:MAG: glucoamylase, partial [Legionella sp.]
WTEILQQQNDPLPGYDILGEPKFYLDGHPFTGSWGRPQNDGPALRATVLIRFAQQLLKNNELTYVRTHLYNNSLDPRLMGCIKMDLEYVAHHWQEANFDLWEEVLGHHFFTAMTQQKALLEGAGLARALHDKKAATFYQTQAQLIQTRLLQHLDPLHHTIKASLLPHSGPQKNLELDSAIILGILINPQSSGEFSPQHDYVKNTVHALYEEFMSMFPINQQTSGAILFGRYPGDTYDGYQTNSEGNPWFILTATMAEYYFTLADQLKPTPANQHLIGKYLKRGDSYLSLIKKYAPDLYISEQINKHDGTQQGAVSLTWSYVAILRAVDLREKVTAKLKRIS